jgi:hypothetical protein
MIPYTYVAVYAYADGRILAWDVLQSNGVRVATVGARSEARAIVSRLNKQARVIRSQRARLGVVSEILERNA